MAFDDTTASRKALSDAVAARFHARSADREAKLADVDQRGMFAAAGVGAAVRRAMQMTVAQGRAAIVQAVPSPDAAKASTLESIIGFNDLDQVNVLERGTLAVRSVCRLVYGGQPIGTGFLVAPSLLLTNHHVIPDADAASGFVAEFDYELDIDENPERPVRFALDPGAVFVTSDVDAYDFTLVGVATGDRPDALARFGFVPLNPASDKILEGEPVIIVQHPQGREKQICMFHSELVDRNAQYLYYTTDTEVGSSGSPTFNRHWQVVGLHHGSAPSGKLKRGIETSANEGIRASSIIEALKSSDRILGQPAPALALLTDPAVQNGPATLASAAAAAAPVPDKDGTEGRSVVRVRAPEWYLKHPRQGYDPAFLGAGFGVPLPGLGTMLARDVARLADGGIELKYEHYSVVMCASRRLAYFSAANLDGTAARSIARSDRDPDHPQAAMHRADPLESADVWWFDGRIPQAMQTGAEVYDGTDFDFGHLTRRLDPVWGDDATLRIANDDTFHMTNCTPQHHKLNAVSWEHMEEAVYAAAKVNGLRFNVITGPVLDPRDPTVKGVQCPVAFWKIVSYVEKGSLVAAGFMQWQTELVAEIQKSLEGLAQLDKAEQWRVHISDIARLTSLDFGPLLDADVGGGPKAAPMSDALVSSLLPTQAGGRS